MKSIRTRLETFFDHVENLESIFSRSRIDRNDEEMQMEVTLNTELGLNVLKSI